MADELIAGRYRLVEPLGRGAMSSVWAADDEELGRRVAVKMLGPAADRARFEREARAAASLSHPNIVSLYDYGEHEGRPFMVLECLSGGSLEERLQAGKPLDDDATAEIAAGIAAGLAHAHDRGLVHRDLKPSNVLFDSEGRPKIADFGIARLEGSGTLTEAGTVLGTATYISPEQAAGRPAGPASDVYSFGVMLFRMLTGVLPFVSTNAMELVRMHRDDPPPAVTDVRPDAPARLESVATAALAKDPAGRPPNGGALLAELRGASGDETMIAGAAATQVLRAAPAAAATTSARPIPPGAIVVAALVLLAAGVAAAVIGLGGGSGNGGGGTTLPNLTLPNVGTARSTTQPTTSTAASTTTEATTTAPTTTASRPTTTRPAATTAPTPTLPVTTVLPPPTTTALPPPTTTDTTPTTTAAPVPTTTAATTTTP